MRLALLSFTLAFLATPLPAQESERPADWKVRFDRPASDSDLHFVTMPPGWHVTTGPACILYDASQTASGEYRLESKIFLFPGERREGFGVFVGGENLSEDNQSYLYFLIRKDGRFLVKQRTGSETSVLIPWTENAAIVPHPGGDEQVENVLAIEAGPQQVDFLVNGEKVASLPRAQANVDGVVGLRVNHSLNLHVAELSVEPTGG